MKLAGVGKKKYQLFCKWCLVLMLVILFFQSLAGSLGDEKSGMSS
jgi:hypothetical protein